MRSSGNLIYTNNIPDAYWKWFDRLADKNSFITMEITRGLIAVVRVKSPIESKKQVVGLNYGKFIQDASGCYLELTYVPRYFPEENAVRSP